MKLLHNQGQITNGLKSLAIISVLVLLTLNASAEGSISVTNYDVDTVFERDGDLTIEWDFTSNQSGTHDETAIQLNDEVFNIASDTVSRSNSVSSGGTVSYSYTFSSSDLEEFQNGTWTFEIEEYVDGGRVARTTQDFDGGIFGSFDTQVDSPVSDSSQEVYDGLTVEWRSLNDYNVERTVESAEIVVEDNIGNTASATTGLGKTVSAGGEASNSYTFSGSEFEGLAEGQGWTVTVDETWSTGTSSSNVMFEGVTEPSGTVSTSVDSPSSGQVQNFTQDLTVEWSSTNDYDVSQVLNEATIQFEDGDGIVAETNPIEVDSSVASGSSTSNQYTVSSSVWESLSPGTWTVTVSDEWEYGSADGSTQIDVTEQTTDDSGSSSPDVNYSISVSSPTSGSTFDYDSGTVNVEWESFNQGSSEQTLSETTMIFNGGAGLTETSTVTHDKSVSSGSSVTNSASFSSSTWSSLEPGSFTLTVRDEWGSGDQEDASIDFTLEQTSDGSGSDGSDGSTDDGTDDGDSTSGSDSSDDSSDSTDDGTDDSTDGTSGSDSTDDGSTDDGTDDTGDSGSDSSDDSDSDDGSDSNTDDSDSSDGSDSSDTGDTDDSDSDSSDTDDSEPDTVEATDASECPNGYEWDEGQELCVDTSGPGEAPDTSPSMMDYLTVGPSAGGVPLWIPLALIVVVGMLFSRSGYELDI